MELLRLAGLATTIVVALSMSFICCGKNTQEQEDLNLNKAQDVPQALNNMHRLLPESLPLDEKCKRYAVLASFSVSYGIPYEGTVASMVSMNVDDLNRRYSLLDHRNLIALYTNAIDRYRVTKLAPPFLDLIECLKLIATPESMAFINERELVLIIHLYKRIIGQSDTMIDTDNVDLSFFSEAFREALKNLFREYVDIQGSSLRLNIAGSNAQQGDQELIQDSHQLKEQASFRRRERSRLTQRRIRLLYPESARSQDRMYRKQRRQSQKLRELSILSQPALTPQEIEIKRRLQEKRDFMNLKRRLRRQKAKERAKLQQLHVEQNQLRTLIDDPLPEEPDEPDELDEPDVQVSSSDSFLPMSMSELSCLEIGSSHSLDLSDPQQGVLHQATVEASAHAIADADKQISATDARRLNELFKDVVQSYAFTSQKIDLRYICSMYTNKDTDSEQRMDNRNQIDDPMSNLQADLWSNPQEERPFYTDMIESPAGFNDTQRAIQYIMDELLARPPIDPNIGGESSRPPFGSDPDLGSD